MVVLGQMERKFPRQIEVPLKSQVSDVIDSSDCSDRYKLSISYYVCSQ